LTANIEEGRRIHETEWLLRFLTVQERTALLPTRADTLCDEEEVSILSWPGKELEGAGDGRNESGTKPPSQPWAQLQEGRRERQRIQSKDCCISHLAKLLVRLSK